MRPGPMQQTPDERREAEQHDAGAESGAAILDFLHAHDQAGPCAHSDQVPLDEQVEPSDGTMGQMRDAAIEMGQPHEA